MNVKEQWEWEDEEFLSYVWWHSQTELALFHCDHVKKLCAMAGQPLDPKETPLPKFISVRFDVAKGLIEAARASIKPPEVP